VLPPPKIDANKLGDLVITPLISIVAVDPSDEDILEDIRDDSKSAMSDAEGEKPPVIATLKSFKTD